MKKNLHQDLAYGCEVKHVSYMCKVLGTNLIFSTVKINNLSIIMLLGEWVGGLYPVVLRGPSVMPEIQLGCMQGKSYTISLVPITMLLRIQFYFKYWLVSLPSFLLLIITPKA